ncbi:MAG: hypothetical protein IPG97_16210 [Microthrixaceae bacterium]|nr:hypothetical protein [Microthrixaceae bacterium]
MNPTTPRALARFTSGKVCSSRPTCAMEQATAWEGMMDDLARCVVGPDGRPMDEDPRAQAVAVGVAEIAALLRVEAQTARNWRTRGVLPEPDWTVSGGPAWSWPRVAAWAMRTGRL